MKSENIKLLYVDLFCGAGGTSTGVETARISDERIAKVIACVNHDSNAIASHAANHPSSLHYTEDIRTLELSSLITHTNKMRVTYPDARVVLWASLECTDFSKAKGGKSRDADSRTLAEHLFRYIEAINPDFIQIENVEEFMSWGDLDINGKPLSRDNGNSYRRWVNNVKKYGYNFDHRILNSADFAASTKRKRFFGQFAKLGLPINWPIPTHSKNGSRSLYSNTKKWRPVKEELDLSDEGVSIFRRKKPLVGSTLNRTYAGLIKFVAGGKSQFLSKYYSGNPACKNISIDEPAGAITTVDHHSIVSVKWMLKYNSINGKTGIHNPPSIDEPCPVISNQGRLGVMSCDFIAAYYSNGDNVSSINSPSPTITTVDRLSIVRPIFESSKCETNHYLMNPQYKSSGGSIDNPCFTIIARMDKMPPYLVSIDTDGERAPFVKVEENVLIYEIYNSDSEILVKIKEFMAMYGIIDIKMRMLKVNELKRIMGFPSDYTLVGTQADQKKFIGNAVEVNTARAMCISTALGLMELERIAI